MQWSSLNTRQAGGEPIQPARRFQDVSTEGALFEARRNAANTVAFEADSQTLVRKSGGQAVSKRARPEPSKKERQCKRGPNGTFRKSQQSCQLSDWLSMAAIDDSQSFESPAAWKLKSFLLKVFGVVSSSVSASWFKLRTVLVGENSSSSNVRTVEAGETASAMIGRVGWMRCAPLSYFWGP